jgi:hypothetical protein
MATAEKKAAKSSGGKVPNRRVGGAAGLQPRRLWVRLIAWALVMAAALLLWFWKPIAGNAEAASSVAARVACSCRFVAGRPLASCRSDFEPGMSPVMLSEDSEARSVTARYALFAPQTATYRAGEGCVLEKWQD